MSYLNDKRRRLGGRELTQPGQVQNPSPVQKQTTPAPQAVQTTTQRPQVQPQAAAPKVLEKQTGGQTAPTTQPSAPAQTGGQDAVTAAQNLLNQQMGSYQSQHGSQIDSLIQQLQGQQPFTYDVNTDPLYLQLRDQWMRDGRLAMEDTMGQAAQLTGGYGNSYAQTAGQQVYNGYMRGLNEMVPQLKEAARADYDAENAYLMQQLGLLMDQDNQDYARWMDELNRQRYEQEWQYQQERDQLSDSRYDQEWQYQQDRDALADQRYEDELAYGREQDQYNRQQDSYDRLLEMIVSTGYKPTAEELAAAGMSEAQAKAWLGYWQGQQSAGGSSGGGGSRGSGGGGGDSTTANNGNLTSEQIMQLQMALGVSPDGRYGPQSQAAAGGLSAEEAYKKYVEEKPGSGPSDTTANGGFTGTTYSEACAFLKANGKPVSGLMTQQEWVRHKNNNNSAGGEHEASSYAEYLAAYIYGAMH